MNFPIKRDERKKIINKANLGMDLEGIINESNEFYLANDIAIIHKKPTPVQIVKVNYPARNKAVITEAYYKIPSTTDYNGIYKGKYIDFEAKVTKSKTAFSLTNIHKHQIKHLSDIYNHGGIAFLIVRFTSLNETYLLLEKDFKEFLSNEERKSVPLEFFKEKAYLLKDGYRPRIDYLKVVDELIGGI